VSLAIMVAFAVALVAFSGRSGVVEVMRHPRAAEASVRLVLRATAFAGLAVITAVIAAVFYELARGGDPSPYAQLGALGGVAYLGALFVLQRRSARSGLPAGRDRLADLDGLRRRRDAELATQAGLADLELAGD